MSYLDILNPQLRIDEGVRTYPYVDTVGRISLGVGRNLTDVGVRPGEIDLMLSNDIVDAEHVARGLLPNFDQLTDLRKAVMVNMAFNLSIKLAGFRQMLDAVRTGRWNDAADEMLDSTWATQVGARATRLAEQMRMGA